MLSCVLPTLDAAASLSRAIAALDGGADEVVVADGGSRDSTRAVARAAGASVVVTRTGRGVQLAAGVAASRGDWLLLLHADTMLAAGWREAAASMMAKGCDAAGYFRFRLDSADPRARRLERVVAWRCRRLGLPYGDQGLLVSRTLLEQVGGVRDLKLMEDVDLVRRIGHCRLLALPADAVTSASRWEREGYVARSARNLCCLSLYFAGVPPAWIARLYG